MEKLIKINRYYSKKGNSFATRNEFDCLDLVVKKLKIDTNPSTQDNRYMEHILKYTSVEKQVREQFDCNKREIAFRIIL
jgi:hypothetical protein